MAANIKNGQILILSATAPETIETVAHTNKAWKNQSEASEYPVSSELESVQVEKDPIYPPSGIP